MLNSDEMHERIARETASRPAYYILLASYLRGFAANRHCRSDALMPVDKRITLATERLFMNAAPQEQAVMLGEDYEGLTPRGRAYRFNILVYKLAKLAGYTAAVILPPDYDEHIEEQKGEQESL